MKDLGDLHYFLRVQIIHSTSSLFLSQHKYTDKFLTFFSNFIFIPTNLFTLLWLLGQPSLVEDELLVDPTYYRSMLDM